jgi:Polysaccharide lyase
MSMLRRRALLACLLVIVAGGAAATTYIDDSLALRGTSSAPAAGRNLTLSFDASPAYSEWRTIQPGYKCVNGAVSLFTPSKPSSAAFIRDDSKGNVRHGKYSARVVLNPGDHASYTCKAEAVEAVQRLGEGEGSSSWWAWSWKLPVGWRGTNSWGELLGFRANHVLWPSYGMISFDAASKNSLVLNLHTGLTPDPGSREYNSAYEESVTLLGPRAPRPMVYGKWLDFYMHVAWRSRSRGVLEIWYREAGRRTFTKLYSNVPGGRALIQVRPHPTLLYNTKNGAPAGNAQRGLVLQGGFYRANTDWTNKYWWDGMRRRRTRASALVGFRVPPGSHRHHTASKR